MSTTGVDVPSKSVVGWSIKLRGVAITYNWRVSGIDAVRRFAGFIGFPYRYCANTTYLVGHPNHFPVR